MLFCIILCKYVLIYLWHVEFAGDWIERDTYSVMYSVRASKYAYTEEILNFHVMFYFTDLFEFSNEQWEQTRVRHFLNSKYLKSYKRAIKKITVFFFTKKKKINKTCINALIMIGAFKQKSPKKFSTEIHFKWNRTSLAWFWICLFALELKV